MVILGIARTEDGFDAYRVYYRVITHDGSSYDVEADAHYTDELQDARDTLVDMYGRIESRGESCRVRKGRYTEDLDVRFWPEL